MTVN